jgi:hypothetical protein
MTRAIFSVLFHLLILVAASTHAETTAPAPGLVVVSEPSGAAIFGTVRGSSVFYGFSPIRITRDNLVSQNLLITHAGFAPQTLEVPESSEISVKMVRANPSLILPPEQNPVCNAQRQDVVERIELELQNVKTRLRVSTPFNYQTVKGTRFVKVSTRVIDRALRAELREARRRGIDAMKTRLAEENDSIVRAIVPPLSTYPCVDFVIVRSSIDGPSVQFELGREVIPWANIMDMGAYTIMKWGTLGTNVSRLKLGDGETRYVDLYFAVGDPPAVERLSPKPAP